MEPEEAIKYLNGAMSLRAPQAKSLELFANYLQSSAGQKLLARMKVNNRGNTGEILDESKKYFSSIPEAKGFEDFERKFPAYTFALATGVGKTRLMGAFVTYLYLVYNIQHFLIVAPNLTIYRKLLDDFSKANNPKYVFKGIQEVNTNNVKIITTDNYAQQRNASLFTNLHGMRQIALRSTLISSSSSCSISSVVLLLREGGIVKPRSVAQREISAILHSPVE